MAAWPLKPAPLCGRKYYDDHSSHPTIPTSASPLLPSHQPFHPMGIQFQSATMEKAAASFFMLPASTHLPGKLLTAFQVMWFLRKRARSKKNLARVRYTDRRNLTYTLHSIRYVSKTLCRRAKYFSYLACTMLCGQTLALSKIASIGFKSSYGN